MSTYRDVLKPYIGRKIKGVTATLAERSGGGRGYGYLLSEIELPTGETIDHCWIGGGEGRGCARWSEGTACLGERIRFTAHVDTYYSEGAARHGNYELGVGIAHTTDEEVLIDEEWVPINDAARLIRARKRAELKTQKEAGNYMWPGTWTYTSGVLRVKAAKSAKPGDLCEVRSKTGMHDETVILVAYDETFGVWTFEYTPERKAQIEVERLEETARWEAECKEQEAKREAERKERDAARAIKKYLSLKTDKARARMASQHPNIDFAHELFLHEWDQALQENRERIAASCGFKICPQRQHNPSREGCGCEVG